MCVLGYALFCIILLKAEYDFIITLFIVNMNLITTKQNKKISLRTDKAHLILTLIMNKEEISIILF